VVICRVVSHTEWPITLSRYFSIWLARVILLQEVLQLVHFH
jgi:hypothetical protein